MARTKSTAAAPEFIAKDEAAPLDAQATSLNQLAVINQAATENATALASELGYDGSLTVGALEDEIRFYQRRTIEACLELGKRLLLLKELTPHGEFTQRVDLLGISDRMARKFMSATIKFSKRNSSSVLAAAGTQTKLLELVILDDGEIEALENGETARGVTLDEIETMTVSELKKALRDARENDEAKARLLAEKNNKIDELSASKSKRQRVSLTDWPEEFQGYINQVQHARRLIEQNIGALDIIRTDSMSHEAAPGEEAALEKAREALGLELAAAITRAKEVIEAAQHVFDKTLGALIGE